MKKLALTIAAVAMTSFSTTTLADPAVDSNTGQCVEAGILERAADPEGFQGPGVNLFDGTKFASPQGKGETSFGAVQACALIPGPSGLDALVD